MVKIETDAMLVDICKLKPYERNNKKHNKAQIDRLAMHIEGCGWDVPIVVDEKMIILKGHGRLEAAKQLGMQQVPVIVRTGLSEAEKRAVRIADNKLAELAEWDKEALAFELEDLELAGWDLEEFGFSKDELDDLLGESDDDGESAGDDKKDSPYTNKIEAPIYKPTGPKPEIIELFDTKKCSELIKQIEESNLPSDEKIFLTYASYRHVVFDYQNIAEYYAHSNSDAQELMEKSALVIIDFKKAIENGFVTMTKDLAEVFDDVT